MMYRDTYRIVTSVSRYVSYREVSVSLQAYKQGSLTQLSDLGLHYLSRVIRCVPSRKIRSGITQLNEMYQISPEP